MYFKRSLMILVVLLVSVAVQAADHKWVGGGVDNRWLTAANWDLGTVPASTERAYLDVAGASILIDTGETGYCSKLIGPCDGVQSTVTLTVKGTLSNNNYWYLGRAPGGEGIVNIDGGTVTARELYLGYTGGTGTINMTGGTLTLSGTSTLGLIIPGDSSSTGTINISGGTFTARFLSMADYGLIDIGTNALVKVRDDVRTAVNGYITSGYITANGGIATVVVGYDGTYTTMQSSLNPVLAKASAPSPVAGFLNVSPAGVVLSWTAGLSALSHNVYFGTDANSLSLVSSEQAGTTYNAGNLSYTTTYYWRIDEVQSGSVIITGDTWQFKTKGSITVDYFETYADTNSLKLTWKDGSADSSSGSSIVLGTTSRETTGTHSCYLSYDNTGAVGGKYIIAPCHALQQDVPMENIVAMYKEIQEYQR